MVAGVHTNPDGTITTGPGVGDAIGNALSGLLGPYGGMVGLGVGWGLREYRHYRLIQAGKKDDNRDGIDDDTQKIPPFRIDGGSSGTAGGAGGTVKG